MAAAKFEPPKGLPTVFDPSYKGVGQKPGIEMWRVEKLAVVKKPPTDECYKGHLYSGDSYIILHTKEKPGALERHIYFWLGKETSQDEMGVAAYKTVELDESLGGEPVQHREVQGHETDEFKRLFRDGLVYLEGGVATGFKHVDRDAFEKRLLHVKGRRNISVQRVEISLNSLNKGDVFILDNGREIFQWNGPESSGVERQKALEICRQIRDEERSGNAKLYVIDEKDDDTAFWKAFGVNKGFIKDSKAGGDDAAHSRTILDNAKLHRLSDSTGSLQITEVNARPLKKELLDTNDCFILDCGAAGIFVWVGKKATQTERLHSTKYALDFLKKKGYPNWTPVVRVAENGETPLFKQYFSNWPELDASDPLNPKKTKASKFVKKTYNAKSMHTAGTQDEIPLPDDGSGTLQIWRVEDFKKVEVPKDMYGQFFGGDSYVMLYTYKDKSGREAYIIYFWQGHQSSQDERGASALLAKELDDQYGGAPVQVRVVQGKEPPHFCLLFKGKLVIHHGGKASGFKNRNDVDKYDTDGTRLFQIKGTSAMRVRAVQVQEKASSLNSGDVFLLESPKAVWLWCGKACSGDEREVAKTIAGVITKREYKMITEGSEPAEFWAALGGKADYAQVKEGELDKFREPRLFQASNATGNFWVEEIFDFDQEDLIEEDVMILDTYMEVFVWVGNKANTEEKKKALETAIDYVKTDKSGRTLEDTSILQLKQGFEPPNFTCHFPGWDFDKWSAGKDYAALKSSLTGVGPTSAAAELAKFDFKVLPYSVLTSSNIPDGVDTTKKELYLSEDEFKKYLGVSKAEFSKLPAWKGNKLKQAANLY